jgi:phosphinothricin acetyltransferase
MHPIAARWAARPAFRYEQIRKMEYMIDIMKPEDWQQVRSIYREGIGTGNSTFEADAPDWDKWDSAHLQEHRLVVQRRQHHIGLGCA